MKQGSNQAGLRRIAADLVWSRVVWCALILLPFGVYMGWAHLPEGTAGSVFWISICWGAGLAMLLGALMGVLAGVGAGLARRNLAGRRGVNAAAAWEAAVYGPVFLWLLLNEVLCGLTYEVFGWDTFLYLFYNPKAVLEASWEMAGGYMMIVFLGSALVSVLLFAALRRVHLRDKSDRPGLPIVRLVRGGVGTAVCVAFATLVWQFLGRPSVALATLSRSAPALRAIRLPRVLLGDELIRDDVEPTWGEPLITDERYAVQMGKPEPALNVVLIIMESVPAKVLGCYGRERDVTPNMDALAAEGALFEQCVAAASFSSYSLVSIVTGLHMLRDVRHDHFRRTDFPRMGLQRMLRLAGYETALFSSGNESFENIREFYPPRDFDKYFSHDTCDIPKWDSMRMEDEHTIKAFADWLRQRTDERPMFCMFNLQSTHFSYEVPEPWASYYQPLPEGYTSGSAIIYMPPDLVPLMQNSYDNALRCVDYWMGRTFEELKGKGMWENTVIVITGDHGEAFMEHGLARHGVHLYDEMVRVPLLIYAPSVVGRRRIPQTVSHLDIAPTIAGLLGLQPHPSWQGRDVLSPDYEPKGRPVFSVLQLTRWQEAVYLDGMKYIYDLSECTDYLFDLQSDPGERVDLARERPVLRDRMRSVLGRWHTRQLAYYGEANRPFRRYIGSLRHVSDHVVPESLPPRRGEEEVGR